MSCGGRIYRSKIIIQVVCYDCGKVIHTTEVDASNHFHGHEWNEEQCVRFDWGGDAEWETN